MYWTIKRLKEFPRIEIIFSRQCCPVHLPTMMQVFHICCIMTSIPDGAAPVQAIVGNEECVAETICGLHSPKYLV